MIHPELFVRIHQEMGPLDVDLFASRLTYQLPRFYSWKTGSSGGSHRCIHPGLESIPRLCKSFLVLTSVDTVQDSAQESQSSFDCSSMEDSTLVPNTAAITVQHSLFATQGLGQGDCSVTNTEGLHNANRSSSVGRMAIIRQHCRSGGLSEAASGLLTASWRDKTVSNYESLFKRWDSWCQKRHRDPIRGPIADIANFLAELFEEGYQYRSLNAYRSAISSVHERVEGEEVDKHPLITCVLKGVFNKRPPRPKYSTIWDVDHGLKSLDHQNPCHFET